MVKFVATEIEPLQSGTYPARLVSIEEKESTLFNEIEPQFYTLWKFVITDEGYTDRFVWGTSSAYFTPRAKARGWAEALLGRAVKTGEAFDEEDLIGKDCILTIGIERDKEGIPRNKILAVTPKRDSTTKSLIK